MKQQAKVVSVLGLSVLAVIASPFAIADDSGWYVGGNVGQSRAKIDDERITNNLLGAGFTTVSVADDDRDTAYKIYGGYRLNKNLAVEAGYFDLGQFGYTATVAPAGTLTGQIRLKGVNIDAVGILPITEKFSAFGRIGLNYAQAKDSFTGVGVVVTNPNPSKNDTNYKFGAGLQYDINESLGLRVEAERYRINDAVGNKGDIDLFSIGLVYRLGVRNPAPEPRAAMSETIVAAPAPKSETPPPPPPTPKKKLIISADATTGPLFGFDKSTVTPAGQQALDAFAADLKGANYEVITVTGHTDRLGPQKYNLKLSAQRAEAVKAYLVEYAGIPADKIEAIGVDGSNPVTQPGECKGNKATAELVACLAPDRRVEVEVVATRTSN